MPTKKQPDAVVAKPAPAAAHPAERERKPWKKKTPVEVILDQAEKLRREIAEMEEDLEQKRKQLQKFDEAKKLFEAT